MSGKVWHLHYTQKSWESKYRTQVQTRVDLITTPVLGRKATTHTGSDPVLGDLLHWVPSMIVPTRLVPLFQSLCIRRLESIVVCQQLRTPRHSPRVDKEQLSCIEFFFGLPRGDYDTPSARLKIELHAQSVTGEGK